MDTNMVQIWFKYGMNMVWDMFSADMARIWSECAQSMDTNMVQIWQIWLRYAAQNMHRICSEYGQDMHQICLSRQDMVRIWSGYGQDMVRIWSIYMDIVDML